MIEPFTHVPEHKRLDFLPSKLPHDYGRFEDLVYDLARAYSVDYKGGYWEFCEHGAAWFMYPDTNTHYNVINIDNHFHGMLPPVEFGLGITLIALSWLANMYNAAEIGAEYTRLADALDEMKLSVSFWAFID